MSDAGGLFGFGPRKLGTCCFDKLDIQCCCQLGGLAHHPSPSIFIRAIACCAGKSSIHTDCDRYSQREKGNALKQLQSTVEDGKCGLHSGMINRAASGQSGDLREVEMKIGQGECENQPMVQGVQACDG